MIYLVDASLVRNEEKDCICPRCPSYPECVIDPRLLLFCIRGKATCEVQRRGCMCPGCKVHTRHHFTSDYYCSIGNEEEQTRTDHKILMLFDPIERTS